MATLTAPLTRANLPLIRRSQTTLSEGKPTLALETTVTSERYERLETRQSRVGLGLVRVAIEGRCREPGVCRPSFTLAALQRCRCASDAWLSPAAVRGLV